MGKKQKSKGRNPRKVSARCSASSPRAGTPKQVDPPMEDAAAQGEGAVGACKHYKKGDDQVNRTLLMIRSSSDADGKCEDCREEPGSKKAGKTKGKNARKRGGAAVADARHRSGVIWVCLDCHHTACGGEASELEPYGHARRHAKQNHHPLAVRLDNPLVGWCFTCNLSISVEMPNAPNGEPGQVADVEELFGKTVENGRAADGTELSAEQKRGYTVRGLTNLGNTCFFNSVMQNLLAMVRLSDYFLGLDHPVGPLTMAVKKLYVDMGGSEIEYKNRITPNNLFGCVCSKAPQFKGYQQQDSHELLRYLLDGLCTEETSYRKMHAESPKENASNGSDGDRAESDSVATFVDAVFGGQLSSTVCCTECGHSSIVYEPFLDLSLPIPTKKVPPKTASLSMPKRSKAPPREGSRGRGRKLRERRDTKGASVLGNAENASSPSEPNVPLANKKPDPDTVLAPTLANDSWWMDYVEPEQEMDNENSVSENCSSSVVRSPENGRENLEYSLSSQCDVYSGESSRSRVHTGEDFCTESAFPKVQDSEVILLPYKDSGSTVDEMTGSTMEFQQTADKDIGVGATKELNEGTLSSIEAPEFYGFSDLFNEPETDQDAKMEASICDNLGKSWLGGNSSESNQEEVDDTNAPVSVDRCLACFTMPELLSGEHAWHCDNCYKILQHQSEENKREKVSSVAKELESKFIQGKLPVDLGPNSLSSFEIKASNSAMCRSSGNGNLLISEASLSQSCQIVDRERYLAESAHMSQYLSCTSTTPETLICQGSSTNEDDDFCLRDELLNAANNSSLEPVPCSLLVHGETISTKSYEKDNFSVVFESPNLSCTTQALDDSEAEKGRYHYTKVKRDATKRILINKAPCILTIHLKRFGQDTRGRLSKLNGHVNFPETLDLRPYMDPRCEDGDSFSYRLVGVVEHSGGMRGGHYVAYVRGEKNSGKNQKDGSSWFYASDAHVHEVSLSEVLQSEAYILFYDKI